MGPFLRSGIIMNSTPAQRRLYHLYKRKLGPAANGLLKKMTGKGSCTDASRWQLDLVLKEMKKMIDALPGPKGAEVIEMPRPWWRN